MFDLHCDTLLKAVDVGSFHSTGFDVTFGKLSTYGKAVQMFALFNQGSMQTFDMIKAIGFLQDKVSADPLAQFCITAEDIESCSAPVAVLSSVEGLGNTPDFVCDDIDRFYSAGVRVMSITWNNDNPLCGGSENNSKGLTDKGWEVLRRMSDLDMVLDVSHISEAGFADACEFDDLNIIATHSDSRTVCHHNRNLTDEQFSVILSRGGVVGLNTYPFFLNGTESADVTDLIRHIEHFCALGGECNIGLGADFDGIECHMADIDSCEKMNILFSELAKLNYPECIIRGIYCENLMNFYKKMKF